MVVQNMAKLFKTEPAKIKGYFSGDRKVIKSKVSELVAEKYRVALENVGLVVKIEEITAAEPVPATAASSADSATASNKPIDTGGITMAEVGANVLTRPTPVEPQPIGDISNISLAELGADVIEHPVPVAPQAIEDISAISMSEVGADIMENPTPVEAQPIEDISDISMAEIGADVIEHPPKPPKTPEVDISELALDKSADTAEK